MGRNINSSGVVATGTGGGGGFQVGVVNGGDVAVRGGPVALAGLGLVEDLGDDELAFFLLLVLSEVVLVHNPVRLLGLPILPEVGVQDQNLLATLLLPVDHHRPRLPGLVPPRLAALEIALSLDLATLSCSRRVSF